MTTFSPLSWLCGFLASRAANHVIASASPDSLHSYLAAVAERWADELAELDADAVPNAPELVTHIFTREPPRSGYDFEGRELLRKHLADDELPSEALWATALHERWEELSSRSSDVIPFFRSVNRIASKSSLRDLARRLSEACVADPVMANKEIIRSLRELHSGYEDQVRRETERNFLVQEDRSVEVNHGRIFPNEDVDVEKIFVPPRYAIATWSDCQVLFDDAPSESILEFAVRTLERQRVFVVLGRYGAGKSIVSKRLQVYLGNRGYRSVYLNSHDVEEELASVAMLREHVSFLRPSSAKIAIFIDGLDDLNMLPRDRRLVLEGVMKGIAAVAATMKGVVFVINSRSVKPRDEDTILEYVDLISRLQPDCFEFAVLRPFRAAEIERWLSLFTHVNDIAGGGVGVDFRFVRELHRRDAVAISHPLFLYSLAAFYRDTGRVAKKANLHEVYCHFVEQTINGKFRSEAGGRFQRSLGKIAKHYERLLRGIAFDMASRERFLGSSAAEGKALAPIDDDVSCMIDEGGIQAIARSIGEELDEGWFDTVDRERLLSNVIHCYFFRMVGPGLWRFLDKNVLYYFLACEVVDLICQVDAEVEGLSVAVLERLGCLGLHARILWFVRQRIDGDADLRSKVEENVSRILGRGSFLLGDWGGLEQEHRVRLELMMVWLGVNCVGAKFLDRSDVLGRLVGIVQYCYSIGEEDALNLLRSSLRAVALGRCLIENMNFNGFDISGSELSGVELENCRFHNVELHHSKVAAVLRMCGVDVRGAQDARLDLRFESCDISRVQLDRVNSARIVFDSCKIGDLSVVGKSVAPAHSVGLQFIGCRGKGSVSLRGVNAGALVSDGVVRIDARSLKCLRFRVTGGRATFVVDDGVDLGFARSRVRHTNNDVRIFHVRDVGLVGREGDGMA